MKKTKRILALTGVVLLAAMYLATLVFALIDSPQATLLFKISVGLTLVIPVLLYGYMLIYRVLDNRGNSGNDQDASGGENGKNS